MGEVTKRDLLESRLKSLLFEVDMIQKELAADAAKEDRAARKAAKKAKEDK